ncbi:MAG: MFS transporter [Anaerolineae bacterium]
MNTAPASQPQPKPQINRWLVFVLICVPILVGAIDLTSIVVVLPQATLDLLGPEGLNRAGDALWAVTAYLLAYTISLALVGRLSDVLPRKSVFIAMITIFIVGALWAGFATDLPLRLLSALPIWSERQMLPLISLIIGRIVQGIGAGASVSVGMALVSDIFPASERARPISLIGALDSLGWVIGNLFGGLLLQVLPSWRYLFLINAALAFAALIGVIIALRGLRSTPQQERFDGRGAILFAAMLIALTIGIELLNAPGLTTYLVLGSSVIFFVAFIWAQLRSGEAALFNMRFIRLPQIRTSLLVNLLVGFSLILVVAGVPLIINLRALFLRGEGLLNGALQAGLMLCSTTVPLLIAVTVGERRYRQAGASIPIATGLLIALIGFLSTLLWSFTAPNVLIAIPLALIGTGLGMTLGPLSLVVVDAADDDERGLASSLVLTMRLLGMTIGTPIAASLTLNLANTWADAQIAPLSETFRNVARPMLIPILATQALVLVMMAGALASAIGLFLFYQRRAVNAIPVRVQTPRQLLRGIPTLLAGIALVAGVTGLDSLVNPTIANNPIAKRLPSEVEFYAGFNIQQMFLKQTKRPLDSVESLFRTVTATASAESGSDLTGDGGAPARSTSADSTIDQVVKLLFRPAKWEDKDYQPFCTWEVPDNEAEYCFNNGLAAWIGPQAAFALLPRSSFGAEFVFLFQATNRNNAIQFATSLANSLGVPPPADVGLAPTIRVMSMNTGTPDERKLAITDAYVIIGTPNAVDRALRLDGSTLAAHPDYQRVIAQMPNDSFTTIYLHSSNPETVIIPALRDLFGGAVDVINNAVGNALALVFSGDPSTPTALGAALRVDDSQAGMNMVAELPSTYAPITAEPVAEDFLQLIPMAQARAWVATHLDISGFVDGMDVDGLLGLLEREPSPIEVRGMLGNPLVKVFVSQLMRSVQGVLIHAAGETALFSLANSNGTAVVLPLLDNAAGSAAEALKNLQDQLILAARLSGMFTVTEGALTSEAGTVATIGGLAVEQQFPGGVQIALTADNLLVVGLGQSVDSLLPLLRQKAGADHSGFPFDGPARFLYGYVDAPLPQNPSSVTIGGNFHERTLYVDVALQPK